jgi:hypothetical protein
MCKTFRRGKPISRVILMLKIEAVNQFAGYRAAAQQFDE